MKVKVMIEAICPKCGSLMISSNYRGKRVLECLSDNCPLTGKYFELPAMEVEEVKEV